MPPDEVTIVEEQTVSWVALYDTVNYLEYLDKGDVVWEKFRQTHSN